MTERQGKKLYWPAWGRAFKRNWLAEGGRVSLRPGALAGDLLDGVCAASHSLARQAHRAPTADDLRHGCHVVAFGRDVSSKHLTNAQIDRVVALFRLLADDVDIEAMLTWQNPARGDEARLDWRIEHAAPEATLRSISSNAFERADWRNLDKGQKLWLLREVKDRRAAWNRPVGVKAEGGTKEYDAANAPW